jgi:FHS family L-fucose permease-like MFS transporter
MPYLAFAVFLIVNTIAQHDMTQFYIYGLVIIAMIVGDILSKGSPARMLLIFSCMTYPLEQNYLNLYCF